MDRNVKLLKFTSLSAIVAGTVIAGCVSQNNNPDNIPIIRSTAKNAGTNASVVPFDAASKTWIQVEQAKVEMDVGMKEKNLDKVHSAATKIRDLVKTLPDQSATLPEDKRKLLDSHVKNVDELTGMMNGLTDSNDMKPVQEHQMAMNDALDMMKGIYPPESMQSSMHMPKMNSPERGMSDDNMPGKVMASMGKANDMVAMDAMTSGMSPADKDKTKSTLGKVTMLKPADRMNAVKKMSGMGKPVDSGKMSGGGMGKMGGMGGKMSGGGMGKMGGMSMMDKMTSGMGMADKDEMMKMMDKMMAMPPAERKKAVDKMSDQPMTGDM